MKATPQSSSQRLSELEQKLEAAEAKLTEADRMNRTMSERLTEAEDKFYEMSAQLSAFQTALADFRIWVSSTDCCYGGSCIAQEVEQRLATLLRETGQ